MTYMIPFNRRTNRTIPANFNNMLDGFFGDTWSPTENFSRDTFKIDVQDSEKEYLIEADLPGVNKEEVNLEMRENTLSIQVSREEQSEENSNNYVHKERRYSSMSRSVYLKDVVTDEIDAKLENGVLTVTVPKVEESQLVKQISIK